MPKPGPGALSRAPAHAAGTHGLSFSEFAHFYTDNHPQRPRRAHRGRGRERNVSEADQNTTVDLGRIAWLGTVVACLIAVLILVLQGYIGYAAVTFAVAVAALINLL